jgi:hypothetical protein
MAKSRYVVIKETIGDIADESVSRNNNLRNFVFDIRGDWRLVPSLEHVIRSPICSARPEIYSFVRSLARSLVL